MGNRVFALFLSLVFACSFVAAQKPVTWTTQPVVMETDFSSWARMVQLTDGSWLAAYMITTTPNRIRVKHSFDSMRTWQWVAEIGEDGRDLDNPTLTQRPDGTVLLAMRSVITGQSYWIETYRSTDSGNSFQYQSQVDWDHHVGGVYEPYLYNLPNGFLLCFYTSEAHQDDTPSYSQTLSEKVSTDGGVTWGSEIFAIAQPGAARPGEANIVALPGGVLALFFEMCGTENCLGHVSYSTDGVTWPGIGPIVPDTFQDVQAVGIANGLIFATSNLRDIVMSPGLHQYLDRYSSVPVHLGYLAGHLSDRTQRDRHGDDERGESGPAGRVHTVRNGECLRAANRALGQHLQKPNAYQAANLLLECYLLAVSLYAQSVYAQSVYAQNLGSSPAPGIGLTDITAAFRLPPIPDAPGSPLQLAVAALQVGSRAKTLGLTSLSANEAWRQAQKLLTPRVPSESLTPANVVVFTGTTASALNQLLVKPGVASVQVTSASLSIDQPLEIQRNGLVLDLGSAQIAAANPQPYMVRIENASSITLMHGSFVSGNSAILVSQSDTVTVSGAQIANLTGAGIVVTGSSHVTVNGNRISAGQLAGIVVHRGTTASIVEHNEIAGNLGFSNMMAGIVVTDREVDIASNPRALLGPDGYWVVQQPMSQRIHPPHDNLIAWNQITQNSSSGVYLDGQPVP